MQSYNVNKLLEDTIQEYLDDHHPKWVAIDNGKVIYLTHVAWRSHGVIVDYDEQTVSRPAYNYPGDYVGVIYSYESIFQLISDAIKYVENNELLG